MDNCKPAKLAYKRFEPDGGADDSLCPVIFLHGMTQTKDSWLDMPQVIADETKRTAYAVDTRNHGDSEYTDFFDYEINAIDMIHFMKEMNISKATLVGVSLGVVTSIRVALKNPGKVEMIFAGDMHTNKNRKEIPDRIAKLIKLLSSAVESIPPGLSEKDAVEYVIELVYDKLEKAKKDKLPYKIIPKENYLNGRMRLKSKPDGAYSLYFNSDSMINFLNNYEKRYEELSGEYYGPAYFIYGSASPFTVKKEEEHIKKYFPMAEMIEFEGASHDVVGDCWDRFTNIVLTGLKK